MLDNPVGVDIINSGEYVKLIGERLCKCGHQFKEHYNADGMCTHEYKEGALYCGCKKYEVEKDADDTAKT